MASTSFLLEDAVIEILSRLPVISLLRFKCVCKSWYALIINPFFISKHINHASSNSQNARLIVSRTVSRGRFFSKLCYQTLDVFDELTISCSFGDKAKNPYRITLYDPCDGIICIQCFFTSRFPDEESLIALWNPATRKLKALPMSGLPRLPANRGKMVVCGFGFDFKTKDYKVVKILHLCESDERFNITMKFPPQAEVYNLSTDTWRKIDTALPPSIRARDSSSAYLNGCYYWWATYDDNGSAILSFDMGEEVFHEIPPPPDLKKDSRRYYVDLAKINESIALSIGTKGTMGLVEVWVMNGDGVDKTWTKQLSAVYDSLEIYSPVAILNNGEALVDDPDGALALYDPSTGKCKNLQLPAGAKHVSFCVFYTESLVSIKGRNELQQQDNSCHMVPADPISILSDSFFASLFF